MSFHTFPLSYEETSRKKLLETSSKSFPDIYDNENVKILNQKFDPYLGRQWPRLNDKPIITDILLANLIYTYITVNKLLEGTGGSFLVDSTLAELLNLPTGQSAPFNVILTNLQSHMTLNEDPIPLEIRQKLNYYENHFQELIDLIEWYRCRSPFILCPGLSSNGVHQTYNQLFEVLERSGGGILLYPLPLEV